MTNDKQIAIVHVSDFHAREEKSSEIQIRIKAFFADLDKQGIKPDLVVVSGDIAFSGIPAEYDFAYNYFFEPLKKRFRVPSERIVICPGNHDIDRSTIDIVSEKGLRASIIDSDTAEEYLDHVTHSLPRQVNYRAFISKVYGKTFDRSWFHSVHQLKGVKVGVAAFDSAWRCADDYSKEQLFLTLRQVGELQKSIGESHLKIAVMHHPSTWYHPSEQTIVLSDLRRGFDLILTGHLHEAESYCIATPTSEFVQCTVPSFFEGTVQGVSDGYNIYVIDYPARKMTVHYRTFFRKRAAYDKNVEHAADGCNIVDLPTTDLAHYESAVLAQTITASGSSLVGQITKSLKELQHLDQPVLVTPLVRALEWTNMGKSYKKLAEPAHHANQSSCIVYGPPDVGTTIFLQSVASEINREDNTRYALYIDHLTQPLLKKTKENLLQLVRKLLGDHGVSETSVSLSLIVDHLPTEDIALLKLLLTTAMEQKWHIMVSIKNYFVFESLAASEKESGLQFIEVCHWGPSRLRQFIRGYLQSQKIDVDTDAAFQFVRNSLAISDLPVTPIIAALYLRVFTELGNQMSGLSFIRLLERLEERNLDSNNTSSSYSIYNLRVLLRKLAQLCFTTNRDDVPVAEYKDIIGSFFKSRYLDIDTDKFVQRLSESGIIRITEDGMVSFTCRVFYNFYLAQALEHGEVSLHEHLAKLDNVLCLGDAMAFYAGRKRDDETLATELLRCIEDEYVTDGNITADDLERHIKHLLNPKEPVEKKDEIASSALKTTIDYERADADFAKSQSTHKDYDRTIKKYTPPSDKIGFLAREIICLKLFYNVFRNAEHLDGKKKAELLDRILDYHIHCNMRLIELYKTAMSDEAFGSFIAYIVTIGGQTFLSQNIGTSALRITIDELLKTTTNDFKRFLLLCLYADLRLPSYASLMESFLSTTEKTSLIEMAYVKIHELMVLYEGEHIPAALISAFNKAFEKRQMLYKKLHPINMQQLRDRALAQAKRQHMLVKQAKEAE